MDSQQIDNILRPMLLPDLRIECRARGINPAGGRPALMERVKEHMLETGNLALKGQHQVNSVTSNGNTGNNYSRPEGQNVGNFLTDKNTSRVLAPPGGKQSFSFYGEDASPAKSTKVVQSKEPSPVKDSVITNGVSPQKVPQDPESNSTSPKIPAEHGGHNNNYHRSEGQNVGNFLTNRNSSRVLAPPGGKSNITFG